LLQEVHPDGKHTYIYIDPDSYDSLAQVRNWSTADGESRQQTHYFHCDQSASRERLPTSFGTANTPPGSV